MSNIYGNPFIAMPTKVSELENDSKFATKSELPTKVPQLTNPRAIDGVNFDGTKNIIHYGTCGDAATQANRKVNLANFTLATGARIAVKFTNTNPANVKLSVNSTASVNIRYNNNNLSQGALKANYTYELVYDGTYWQVVGELDSVYTHPNSGVTAGTYDSVTVDAQGHVTAGSNPARAPADAQPNKIEKIAVKKNGALPAEANAKNAEFEITPTDKKVTIPIPYNTSYFTENDTNDAGFLTAATAAVLIPTKVSDLENDQNYITVAEVPDPTKLANPRKIDGVKFDGSADIHHFATCSTAAGTAAKSISLTNFELVTGAKIAVRFTNGCSVANPTLKINNLPASNPPSIYYGSNKLAANAIKANNIYEMVYDGSNWRIIGDLDTNTDTNTTYTAGTGLSLNGTIFNHSNSITKGTASEGGNNRTLAFGDTFKVPSVSYDDQGHITKTGTTTLTMPASPTIPTVFAPTDAEKNKIQVVKVNGDALPITEADRSVNITMPTSYAPTDAEKNKIQTVKVNGTALVIDSNRAVNITVPTVPSTYAPADAEKNKIDGVQLNGTDLTITNKKVNVQIKQNGTLLTNSNGAVNVQADKNIIETVKVNNTALTPDSSKAVNITIPTAFAPTNAQANVIEKIQKNGTDLTITNKTVNITVPTKVSDLEQDVTPEASDSLATARLIDGISFDGSKDIHHYAVCTTGGGTAAKVATIYDESGSTQTNQSFTLKRGATVNVKFTQTSTLAANTQMTLNVNSTGAKNMLYGGKAMDPDAIVANKVYTFVYDGNGWVVTGNVYQNATQSVRGFMTAADKKKLDGIAASANNYSHPTYTARNSGLYKITVNNLGHVTAVTAVAKADITGLGIPASDTTYSVATQSANGLMSSTDKKKLDGIAENAAKITITRW